MKDRAPTMRSRLLGSIISSWIGRGSLWNSEAARRLDVSPSKVSRMASGKRGVTAAAVAGLAALCDVSGSERARALYLAENLEPTWLEPYGTTLPEQTDILTHAEGTATTVTEYQPLAVPELLQVAAYARLHIRAAHQRTEQDEDQRVDLRLARQAVLDPSRRTDPDQVRRPTTRYRFLVDQRVLDDPGIPSGVMGEQIHHLLRVSVLPTVTVLVIPTTTAASSWGCTPFRLFEFTEQRPAVYLANLNSVLVLEDHAAVQQYRQILSNLDETSNPTNSRALLAAAGQRLSHQAGESSHTSRGQVTAATTEAEQCPTSTAN